MFNILDLVIIAVIVLSAIFAAWRGFTRETLSIGAWVGAAIVMFLFGDQAVPLVTPYVEHAVVAKIAAYAGVFLVALIPLAYVSYRISESVRDSFVGPVDRLLGLVFGVARGLVVVGIGYLVFTSLVGENRLPDWFKEARLQPLMASTGNLIATLLPDRSEADQVINDAVEDIRIGGKKKPDAAPDAAPEEEPAEQPAPPPKPKPAKPAEAAPSPKPAKAEPKTPPARPRTESAEAAPVPRAAKATPKPKPVPKAEPATESSGEGYGERERDALDQLIGSATASPAKKPSEDEAAGKR